MKKIPDPSTLLYSVTSLLLVCGNVQNSLSSQSGFQRARINIRWQMVGSMDFPSDSTMFIGSFLVSSMNNQLIVHHFNLKSFSAVIVWLGYNMKL